ncbi:MAG TPA: hypothetical protein VJC18_06845, partial [bacterium]|nr:hypothetical protein [bacterium]
NAGSFSEPTKPLPVIKLSGVDDGTTTPSVSKGEYRGLKASGYKVEQPEDRRSGTTHFFKPVIIARDGTRLILRFEDVESTKRSGRIHTWDMRNETVESGPFSLISEAPEDRKKNANQFRANDELWVLPNCGDVLAYRYRGKKGSAFDGCELTVLLGADRVSRTSALRKRIMGFVIDPAHRALFDAQFILTEPLPADEWRLSRDDLSITLAVRCFREQAKYVLREYPVGTKLLPHPLGCADRRLLIMPGGDHIELEFTDDGRLLAHDHCHKINLVNGKMEMPLTDWRGRKRRVMIERNGQIKEPILTVEGEEGRRLGSLQYKVFNNHIVLINPDYASANDDDAQEPLLVYYVDDQTVIVVPITQSVFHQGQYAPALVAQAELVDNRYTVQAQPSTDYPGRYATQVHDAHGYELVLQLDNVSIIALDDRVIVDVKEVVGKAGDAHQTHSAFIARNDTIVVDETCVFKIEQVTRTEGGYEVTFSVRDLYPELDGNDDDVLLEQGRDNPLLVERPVKGNEDTRDENTRDENTRDPSTRSTRSGQAGGDLPVNGHREPVGRGDLPATIEHPETPTASSPRGDLRIGNDN